MANSNGRAYAIRILCPVDPARVDALRTCLDALQSGDQSPLAIGTTHLGRLVLISEIADPVRSIPSEEDLSCPYLLLSCTFDGTDPRAYLRDLFTGSASILQTIWSHCIGFPASIRAAADPEPAIDYLLKNQLQTDLFFSAYPNATVREICRALDIRTRFIDLAVSAPDHDAEWLMTQFRAQFQDLIR